MSCPRLLPLLPSLTSVFTPTHHLLFPHHSPAFLGDLWVFPVRPPSPFISDPHTDSSHLLSYFPSCPQKLSRQKEERTGSVTASHAGRGLDIIYLYLHRLLLGGEGGRRGWRVRDGAVGLGSEMFSHIDTSYSRVSCVTEKMEEGLWTVSRSMYCFTL